MLEISPRRRLGFEADLEMKQRQKITFLRGGKGDVLPGASVRVLVDFRLLRNQLLPDVKRAKLPNKGLVTTKNDEDRAERFHEYDDDTSAGLGPNFRDKILKRFFTKPSNLIIALNCGGVVLVNTGAS